MQWHKSKTSRYLTGVEIGRERKRMRPRELNLESRHASSRSRDDSRKPEILQVVPPRSVMARKEPLVDYGLKHSF